MRKIIGIAISLIALGTIAIATGIYYFAFIPNVKAADNGAAQTLFIPTGADFDQVMQNLQQGNILKNSATFKQLATQMNYPKKIYPGRYILPPNMNNRDLVRLLRSGTQTPYEMVINNIRTKNQLIQLADSVLEATQPQLEALLSDTAALAQRGFTPDNIIAVFMADTYQFNWNTTAEQFLDRMVKEYNKFWNDERKAAAQAQQLTPYQVVTLASIVEEETVKTDEMPRIAGAYLNRLRTNMPLQADPTVKFAVGDFTLKRILQGHLDSDSPYNTYKVIGLPPGPIRIPAKNTISSVLNAEKHDYIYFCAREDFSGYHNFATNYADHLINANKYRRELDRRQVK